MGAEDIVFITCFIIENRWVMNTGASQTADCVKIGDVFVSKLNACSAYSTLDFCRVSLIGHNIDRKA